MAKKILMVSPFPSHPQNAGSNIRIFQIASGLKKMGHEVHFLLNSQSDDCDKQTMHKFWGDYFYDIPPKYQYARRNLPRRIVEKIKDLFNLELYFLDNWYYGIDDWYDQALDLFLFELTRKVAFDVVLVEYVFLSQCFKHFGYEVLKMIDTHDIFANRHRQISGIVNGEAYKWFTATPQAEATGLNRADIVIAIQTQEEKFFKQLTGRKVITIGHLLTPEQSTKQNAHNHELLFVGTKTQENREGVEFFVTKILPKVQDKYPQAKLLLAGKIGEVVADFTGCIKLGVVDDLRKVYQRAAIVINPALTGTGLAIKSIEALSHARPLVAMPRGARGLEDGGNSALLIAKNAEEFANYIIRLFDEPEFRKTLSDKARKYACRYHRENLDRLAMVIEKHET